mmetsp:Transcript_9364/g.24178  ORF Transcript_9364/g.24178 Transcript_9364/m.24178 type:complete len:1018 (+) Transcript_9364:73-3126(+)
MCSSVLRTILLVAAVGTSLGFTDGPGCSGPDAVACDTQGDDTSIPALVQLTKQVKLATRSSTTKPCVDCQGSSPSSPYDEAAAKMPRAAPSKTMNHLLVGKALSRKDAQKRLADTPRILGATRDFWIMWGIVLGGCALCFIATVISVQLAIRCKAYDLHVNTDKTGAVSKPSIAVSFLQRAVFRADLNPIFAYNADMAMRTAIICAVCSLTYFVEDLKFMNVNSISMQYAVVIICFTVYMDLGTTLSLAWYNLAGTLLPVLNCQIMYGIFPNGSTDGGLYSTVWWAGLINFMVFMLMMMAMKWPVGIRMFAVSWQAYFSMCFLDPEDDTHFSNGATSLMLDGAAVGPLIGTVIGCCLAVLPLAFFPGGTTLSALSTAQDQSIKLAWNEARLWSRMIKYFKGSEKTVLVDRLIGDCDALHHSVTAFSANLGSNSWWECFDMGKPGRVRAHMVQLSEGINYMNDWLRGGVFAMKNEDFQDDHDKLMAAVGPQLERLADTTGVLLYRSALAAADGGVAPHGRMSSELLQKDIDDVNDAQRELSFAFVKARNAQYGSEGLTDDAVSEHFFLFAISLYAQYTTEFADYLISGEVCTPTTGLLGSAWQSMKDMCTLTGWGFFARSSIGFFLAFYLGFRGLSGILDPYNANVAGTTAYLMASDGAAGSAIMKNIARFQGTAGGTIIGQLLWSVCISCTWRGNVMGFMSVLVLELLSMYLYFASASFGYVGVLLGAFGAQHIMVDCAHNSGNSKADIYSVIEEQMLAILCVTLGDLLVGNTSPGFMATSCYHNVTEVITQGFGEFLCLDRGREVLLSESRLAGVPKFYNITDVKDVEYHRDAVLKHLGAAKSVGKEAPLEPRWFRTPWRTALWMDMMQTASNLGICLAIMEYAVWRGEAAGAVRRALITSPAMTQIAKDMHARTDFLFVLAKKLMTHENEGPFGVSSGLIEKTRQQKLLELNASNLQDIIKDVSKQVKKSELPAMLTQDEGCQLGVVILMTQNMMITINSLENAIFGQKELLSAK